MLINITILNLDLYYYNFNLYGYPKKEIIGDLDSYHGVFVYCVFYCCIVSPQGDLPHCYSPHVIHFIPVKRLLLECTKQQVHYAPLYPRLIKLLVTHLPHLCLVMDWMEQEEKENSSKSTFPCC